MAEYIEREAALNRLCQENCGRDFVEDKCHNCYTSSFITYLPAADVVPVVHGRWIAVDDEEQPCDEWDCTACGQRRTFMCEMDADDMQEYYPYCPNCGARMDGE